MGSPFLAPKRTSYNPFSCIYVIHIVTRPQLLDKTTRGRRGEERRLHGVCNAQWVAPFKKSSIGCRYCSWGRELTCETSLGGCQLGKVIGHEVIIAACSGRCPAS